MTSRRRVMLAAASVLLAVAALTACAPDGGGPAAPSATSTGSASPWTTPTAKPTSSATPTPTAEASVPVPTDCRAILTEAVLSQLASVPLNDPAFGASGVQPDGSLICIWGDPGADTTGLTTTISKVNRGPALDMLNALADTEGFTCYTPDGGTRCEKTWQNETYPVTDGRTLFWRSNVLIDTRYSNLAPTGYTAAIVGSLFS